MIPALMTKTREKITLIDGSGYIFRAFYAIQRLSTSKGFPTNAIYGFINSLVACSRWKSPRIWASPSTRRNRPFARNFIRSTKRTVLSPDDLVKHIPAIFRAVDAFGVRRFELAGFEADDIIATVAAKAEKSGYQVEIITGDKVLMQLVGPHITLYDTMKEKRIDAKGVFERFQVEPRQVVDLLALMGDSSDNIPGVTGIGEKTAAELIGQSESSTASTTASIRSRARSVKRRCSKKRRSLSSAVPLPRPSTTFRSTSLGRT